MQKTAQKSCSDHFTRFNISTHTADLRREERVEASKQLIQNLSNIQKIQRLLEEGGVRTIHALLEKGDTKAILDFLKNHDIENSKEQLETIARNKEEDAKNMYRAERLDISKSTLNFDQKQQGYRELLDRVQGDKFVSSEDKAEFTKSMFTTEMHTITDSTFHIDQKQQNYRELLEHVQGDEHLSSEDKVELTKSMFRIEMHTITHSIMPFDQKQQKYRELLDRVQGNEHVSQEYKVEFTRNIFRIEMHGLTGSTRTLPFDQQQQRHQEFLDRVQSDEHASPELEAEIAQHIHSIERLRDPNRNRSETREDLVEQLLGFGDEILADPDKIFPGDGPKDPHEHLMVWVILGKLRGHNYPIHDHLRGEEHRARSQELEVWTRSEFAKWQEANRSQPDADSGQQEANRSQPDADSGQ